MEEQGPTYVRFRRGDLRRSFLEGARVMLRERGLEQFSLNELARRIGVSPASAYRHFADKQELLAQISEEGYHELRDSLVRDVAETTPGGVVVRLAIRYLEFAVANPELFVTMFRNRTDATRAVGRESFAPLVEAVIRAQHSGALPEGEPLQVAGAVWMALHGITELHLIGGLTAMGLDGEPEQLIRQNFAILFPGLQA